MILDISSKFEIRLFRYYRNHQYATASYKDMDEHVDVDASITRSLNDAHPWTVSMTILRSSSTGQHSMKSVLITQYNIDYGPHFKYPNMVVMVTTDFGSGNRTSGNHIISGSDECPTYLYIPGMNPQDALKELTSKAFIDSL